MTEWQDFISLQPYHDGVQTVKETGEKFKWHAAEIQRPPPPLLWILVPSSFNSVNRDGKLHHMLSWVTSQP